MRCCQHSGPSSTTTRHAKGFHKPTTEQVLKCYTNTQYLSKSTSGSHANYKQKFKETQPCTRTPQSGWPPRKFLPHIDKIVHPYNQLWLPSLVSPDEWLASKILPTQACDPRTDGWLWRHTFQRPRVLYEVFLPTRAVRPHSPPKSP